MSTKIYYFREHLLKYVTENLYFPLKLPSNFKQIFNNNNYIKVYDLEYTTTHNTIKYLESLFDKFNSNENPLLKTQNVFSDDKTHIKMSIGDVIKYHSNYYVVMGCGFRKIS